MFFISATSPRWSALGPTKHSGRECEAQRPRSARRELVLRRKKGVWKESGKLVVA